MQANSYPGLVSGARHGRGNDDEDELEPVEERDAVERGLDAVEERHPDGDEERDEQDHVPDGALAPAGLQFSHGLLPTETSQGSGLILILQERDDGHERQR